jgi:hypothetical protein
LSQNRYASHGVLTAIRIAKTKRNGKIAGSIDVAVEAQPGAIDHPSVEHIAELVLVTLET